MKNAYYYLFYKIYRFSESAPSKWLSDWKAVLVIMVLEILLYFSGLIYYISFYKTDFDLSLKSPLVLIPGAFVLIFNSLFFKSEQSWKEYVHKFDAWPKKKNLVGGIITWAVIVFIFVNFIFSIYVLSQHSVR